MTTLKALTGHQLVVVDVEGNGGQPPEIIEIAAIPLDDAGTGLTQEWMVRPQRPISRIVTHKVHGIRNSDVADCPTWAEIATEVASVLGSRVLVAHNAAVEYRVLRSHLPNWKPPLVLDTLRLARHLWPTRPSHALDQLDLDETDIPGHRHRAAYDAQLTQRLLVELLTNTDLDWHTLVGIAALPAITDNQGLW